MFLRQLEYLVALSRERHFGRAARACHVSQPALSTAIRKLEQELGLALVHRGRDYHDLTAEGHAIVGWARQALAGIEGLVAEASELRNELSGTLRLGVIPTALSAVSLITRGLLESNPNVRLEVRSQSSIEIGRRLAEYELDAGITYLDNEPLGAVAATPIYEERYIFLTARAGPYRKRKDIHWNELGGVSLCLLTPDMQNRRIIDSALRAAGVEPGARVEANSISALLSFARVGWSCVVAHTWLALHGLPAGMLGLPLIEPELRHVIGLVTSEAEPLPPLVRALRRNLAATDVNAELVQLASRRSF